MSDVVARTGRHHQRYENEYRLVAGCIPYKLKNDVEQICTLEDALEVLMVSTPDRDDLVFPKGGWEDDESVEEAACREALEEAGVKGDIDKKLGTWEFQSKRRQNSSSLEGICRGYMFTMRVTEELDSWPEQTTHGRRWVMVRDAFELCRYPWMREALEKCLRVLAEDYQPQLAELTEDILVASTIKEGNLHSTRSEITPKKPSNATIDRASHTAASEVTELSVRSPSCFMEPSTSSASTAAVNALC
ncbi:nudix hydrolase 13, mitochondrial [Nymphaea colorata]|nr:nudix hydrolase 13, mitochondrial [Nymphaea colorata]XP_031490413.1 nudix hydrolase 13, mitochondrial [Nymphaea colorata]XP_031490414.1 nudix hydrolase 13, mitochondrial [Nymphaea colorata]XP_031490415.1 nudix hydrolase 13, mitochondrial [Nymphaea colorata]XP_031490416.1 nudix hydrolase 13, mitochondrial [Nymphaea colorata]